MEEVSSGWTLQMIFSAVLSVDIWLVENLPQNLLQCRVKIRKKWLKEEDMGPKVTLCAENQSIEQD